MQSVPSIRASLASSTRDLHDDATCTIRVVPPPVLKPDWKTTQLAFRRSKPLDLDACPVSSSSACWFVGQPINHSPLGFETQTKKPSRWFWDLNHQTIVADFEAQTGKPVATGFEAKPEETVNLGFEVKPRNPWPHTASPDISIIQPPSTRPVLNYPRSYALCLLLRSRSSSLPIMPHLSPAHHETSKHDSPHEQIGVKPSKSSEFKFKPRQVNCSSQLNHGTHHLISQI
jgi:hypothetical protein